MKKSIKSEFTFQIKDIVELVFPVQIIEVEQKEEVAS